MQAIPNSWHWRRTSGSGRWFTCALLIVAFACGPAGGDKTTASAPAIGITHESPAGGAGVDAGAAAAPADAPTAASDTTGGEQGYLTAPALFVGTGGVRATDELPLAGSAATDSIATEDAPLTVVLAGAAGSSQTSTSSVSANPPAGGAPASGTTSRTTVIAETAAAGAGIGGARASTATSLGGAGSATTKTSPSGGASFVNTSETLKDVIKRFCALQDVSLCDPDCYDRRILEAKNYTQCNELYRALMLCQLALPNLTCSDLTVVVSTGRCLAERNGYKKCLGL